MKIVGVIPARYASTRFPGKPLADICGRPMIWWVYRQTKLVSRFDEIVVAVDDQRVADACASYGIKSVMTSSNHPTHINRLHEVSQNVEADLYVCVCGDEPLTEAKTIAKVIPNEIAGDFIMQSLMREFQEPTEALDPSNIKVVTTDQNECILLTRSMVPFPYKSLSYKFKKLVGIECYSHSALDFFHQCSVGVLEKIEDIALLRFIENRKPMRLVMSDAHQLGVDTPKDLDYVRQIIQSKIEKKELTID